MVYAFLKFGKQENLQQLREEGLLYLNPLRYFSDLESDSEKGDSFEGLDTIYQPKDIGEFIFDTRTDLGKITIAQSELAGSVRIGLDRTMACNVYCMFAITRPVDGELVDRRNFGFGDSCVLVLNPTEFLNRAFSAAEVTGLSFECDLVEYYDSAEYTGDVGPFRKRSRYAHQNEFRFVVRPGSNKAIKLIAGSLLDITSEVLPLSEVNQHLDFSTKSAKEAGLSWL